MRARESLNGREKNGAKENEERGSSPCSLLFLAQFFSCPFRLPSPPLSAHGYPRMGTKLNRDDRKTSQTEREKYIE